MLVSPPPPKQQRKEYEAYINERYDCSEDIVINKGQPSPIHNPADVLGLGPIPADLLAAEVTLLLSYILK